MPWRRNRFQFPEYVSVSERRGRAAAAAEKAAQKQKRALSPVGPVEGQKLARSFWGKAWCNNLEAYSDYASRLPRGRSYARHGAVIDLQLAAGKVSALVTGTRTYQVEIAIAALAAEAWTRLASECAAQIDSLVDLLRGSLPERVMELVTRKEGGLFPSPLQISFKCTCPDWAGMCKHVAAALYGVGMRLDETPELLFALRGVDHNELVGRGVAAVAAVAAPTARARGRLGRKVLEGADLSALFGIDLEAGADVPGDATSPEKRARAGKPVGKAKGRTKR